MIGLEPGTRPAGLIARRHQKKTIASRDSGRRSFCCMRRNGGRPPPFPLEEAPRAGPCLPFSRSRAVVCAPAGVAGNRETAASRRIRAGGRHPPDRRGYTPGVPGSRRGGSDRGGPAIARSGRVVRPVRRPSDRQTNRRNTGGDPREICNQIPDREARDLSIPGLVGAGHTSNERRTDWTARQLHPAIVVGPSPTSVDGTRFPADSWAAASTVVCHRATAHLLPAVRDVEPPVRGMAA